MTGLREQKKEAARLALHGAALRLMSAEGGEHVTVEAIAEAASMSRRTFSNYFANKEEAVFYRDAVRSRELLHLVKARPDDEGPLEAIRAAFEEFAADFGYDAEHLAQRRIINQRPEMAAYRTRAQMATEKELAAELLHRTPPGEGAELSSNVLAVASLAALRVARTQWLEDQTRALRDVLADALRHLRD